MTWSIQRCGKSNPTRILRVNDKLSYTLDELAAKLDESDFKSKMLGESDFKSKMLGKVINLERLTDIDPIEFEHLIDNPTRAMKFAVQQVIDSMRTQKQILDSLKKFFDIERDGAKGRKGAITRRRKMQIRDDHVREKLAELRRKNPTLTPDQLAENLLLKPSPVPLLCYDRLVRFIRAERKSGATTQTNPPRLVHG